MRYTEGGGLIAEGRARREEVRLRAARPFEQGLDARGIANLVGEHEVGVPVAAGLAGGR
jgi:hypothetical protein